MLEELLRPLCFITFHGDDFLTPSLLLSVTQACATDERSGVTKLINPEPYLYLNMRTFFLSFSLSLCKGPTLSRDPSVFVPWCPAHSAGEVQFHTLTVTKTMSG